MQGHGTERGPASASCIGYILGVFLKGADLPEEMADWSLTSPQTRLIKIGARVVRHARAITFQLAEVAVSGALFRQILTAIQRLRTPGEMSASKSEKKRLDRAVQTCADQTVSCADPAAETRNRGRLERQVPRHWLRARKRHDPYAIGRQHDGDSVLLGKCRFKSPFPMRNWPFRKCLSGRA